MSGGDFSRAQSYTSSNNEDQSTAPGSAGFWPDQSVYPHPPIYNNQRFSHVQADWQAFALHPGQGGQEPDYRSQYPQYTQGFQLDPRNISLRDFDPTRPPPPLFSSQGYDETSRQTSQASGVSADFMQRGGFMESAQGNNIGFQTQIPYFDRPFDGSPLSGYAPRFNQVGIIGRGSENAADSDSACAEPPFRRWPGGDAAQAPHLQPQAADSETEQRRTDEKWILMFLLNRKIKKPPTSKQPDDNLSVGQLRERLYDAVQLVSELSLLCQALKQNMENDSAWSELHAKALEMRADLQDKLNTFSESSSIDFYKKKIDLIRTKRTRIRRKKREQLEEKKEKDARELEKETLIDTWRMKRIQQVEEKKRELELRQAADSVLSEVRKKQVDTKRMQDVLRSLEKLRKLRKEAAARKGVHPEREEDEAFEGQLDRLRQLIRKRTAVYAAEEKALRVMLEVEQEEERRREQEHRQRREREKLLQRRRLVGAALFGEETPAEFHLQAFRQYYLRAESSLHALIQTRREWDQYLVPPDHPDGSCIPQMWVLPEPPSDEAWAAALEKRELTVD